MPPRTISELDPTELENLAFDLLQAAGLQNLVWRTPGADGGRDLEGVFALNDLSGEVTQQRWYVECKRYSTSIDWPTIWHKLGHADNHGADYLLLFTNSQPSPACESEITTWNSSPRRVKLRVWRGYQIARILRAYRPVGIKHGLAEAGAQLDAEFTPLMVEVMKITQAAHAAHVLGMSPETALEAGAALIELVTMRMAQVREYGRSLPPVAGAVPDYPWLDWSADPQYWDEVGLRATLSFLRHLWVAERLVVTSTAEGGVQVTPSAARAQLGPSSIEALKRVSLWTDVEVSSFSGEEVAMRPRR